MRRELFIATGVAVVALAMAVGPISGAAGEGPRFCRVGSASAVLRAAGQGATKPRGVVLLANRSQVAPGGRIFARLANFGGLRAGYGLEFSIQRQTGSGWELDPESPDGPWPRVGGVIAPGAAGKCYRFQVPSELSPGRYRFATRIRLQLGKSREALRTAAFAVR